MQLPVFNFTFDCVEPFGTCGALPPPSSPSAASKYERPFLSACDTTEGSSDAVCGVLPSFDPALLLSLAAARPAVGSSPLPARPSRPLLVRACVLLFELAAAILRRSGSAVRFAWTSSGRAAGGERRSSGRSWQSANPEAAWWYSHGCKVNLFRGTNSRQ